MKIAIAQNRPIVGPAKRNLAGHLSLMELALRERAELVVFPELSLTGYEPQQAAECVRSLDDACLDCLRSFADENKLIVGAGLPTPGDRRPRVSTVVFRPGSTPEVFSKQHLHADELDYFEPGPPSDKLLHANPSIALAICYEISLAEHARAANQSGAAVYLASVAKHARGVDEAYRRLSTVASEYAMLVLMSNCLGWMDGAECVGRSAAWDRDGRLLAQMDADNEGILLLDVASEIVVASTIPATPSGA